MNTDITKEQAEVLAELAKHKEAPVVFVPVRQGKYLALIAERDALKEDNERLHAEIASLKEERDILQRGFDTMTNLHALSQKQVTSLILERNDLNQQLAAANGRVEKMREALMWIAAQPTTGAIQSRATAALSDLPEADKEKS